MDPDTALNVFDAVLIIGVSIPSLYMATRVDQPKLRILSSLLAGFLLVHGSYHATSALGDLTGSAWLGTASTVFFEPFGYFLFLAFAIYFASSTT